MDTSFYTLAIIALVLLCIILWQRYHHISVAHIPGPTSESFLLGQNTLLLPFSLSSYSYASTGNLRQFFQCQAGEADFKWQEEFGGIVRIRAPFGVRPILEALFFHNDWVI